MVLLVIAMLQITPNQWAALCDLRTEDFVARARQRLLAVEQQRFPRLDGNAQRAGVLRGIEQSRQIGLSSERAVMWFLEVDCLFAARRDLRVRYGEWATNLFSCGTTDPERTMAYLHQVISVCVLEGPAPPGGEGAASNA